jgi:hypothetical protein
MSYIEKINTIWHWTQSHCTFKVLIYTYIIIRLFLRDEQAVYKQGCVHAKPNAHHVCHNTYPTVDVINNMCKSDLKRKSASLLWYKLVNESLLSTLNNVKTCFKFFTFVSLYKLMQTIWQWSWNLIEYT